MKKILVISYDFAPLRSIAAQRVNSWVPGLSAYNLKPVLITRTWENNITNSTAYFEPDTSKPTFETQDLFEIHRFPLKLNLLDNALLKANQKNWIVLRKALTLCQSIGKWLPGINIDKAYLYQGARKALEKGEISAILVSGEPFILFKYAYALSKEYNIPFFLD